MKQWLLIFFLIAVELVWAQKSEELFIQSFDSLKLSGTLLLPKKKVDNLNLAIIISGSGPTDRNGNNMMMTNNSLKFLAEGLAKNKIASFRFDKRGVGKSLSASIKESDLRFEDYIKDIISLIEFFEKDKRFSSIIVIGHSEGSLLGMIASQKTKVRKFVSIAGVGRTADLVLKDQLKQQYGINNVSPILDSLKAGYIVSPPKKLMSLFRTSVQPYMISWFRYNPQQEIKKLKIPVLILQGGNDIQVKVMEAELLKKAYPNADYKIIPKMNHIMKIIDGDFNDNLKSYYDAKVGISKLLINKVSKFISSSN